MLRRIDCLLPGDTFLTHDKQLFTVTKLGRVIVDHRELHGYYGKEMTDTVHEWPCKLAVRLVERHRLLEDVLNGIREIQQPFDLFIDTRDIGMVLHAIAAAGDMGWNAAYNENTARLEVLGRKPLIIKDHS